MVHPMMMSADMWDVTRDEGAVGILHKAGIDPWVIDFGVARPGRGRHGAHPGRPHRRAQRGHRHGQEDHRPRRPSGRLLAGRHVVLPDRRVTADPRDLASIIAFGSPVDTLAALPMGLPPNMAARGRGLHGRPRVQPHRHPKLVGAHRFPDARPDQDGQGARGLPAPAARPRGPACPANSSADSWSAKAGSPGRGPAISELLKQFIAHNRMMTGGFAIHGELVTLTDINCPGAGGRRRGRRHRPAGRRCAASSAPRPRPTSTNT